MNNSETEIQNMWFYKHIAAMFNAIRFKTKRYVSFGNGNGTIRTNKRRPSFNIKLKDSLESITKIAVP